MCAAPKLIEANVAEQVAETSLVCFDDHARVDHKGLAADEPFFNRRRR
jgi:hypothetical protein